MDSVARGKIQKTLSIASEMLQKGTEQRLPDSVRNTKNYMIILNTILRKAAEYGSVHPFYIDKLSSSYARKIETITSVQSGLRMQKEMIHKYCLLVKNHSMKNYSPLVRNAITHIDADLTADLSLASIAGMLNTNPSYLSKIFRAETGSTLTDYVARKRIDHAIFLLNTTNMQIQTIAQYCGIPDANYFVKVFRKYIHKTPNQYRQDISV